MINNSMISYLRRPLQYILTKGNYCNFQRKIIKFNSNKNNLARVFSQQHAREADKSFVRMKKSHPRRNLLFVEEKTIEKPGFWNVVAVATAEEYNLNKMYENFLKHESYQPSELHNEIFTSELGVDFLHVVAKTKVDNENREIFIFREGSFVVWNISDIEIKNLLNFVQDFEINKYDSAIVNDEIEIMPYTYSINSKHSVLQNGNLYLTQEEEKCIWDKYTYSNGMMLSVKLGIWESLLDKYIQSSESVTMDLKLGNPIKMSRKEILRKTGELFALKHSINLSSSLLDVPDFYWEREELENRFLKTCRYFNLPKRTKVINDKLNHCIELVDLLSSHLSDRHHVRLEWMIIILIMVEVGFEIIHYAQLFVS